MRTFSIGKNLFPLNPFDKTKWFFLNRKKSYWHSVLPCQIFSMPKVLPKYYLDMIAKANYSGPFNEKGIFLTVYSFPVGIQEYSIHLSYYALGCLAVFEQTKNKEFLKKFLIQSNWLAENLKEQNGFFAWQHDFELKYYCSGKPWISAMAQGLGISVLLRAYKLSGEKRFLETAEKALTAFAFEIEKNGFVSELNNEIFFEEIPSNPNLQCSKKNQPHILNGMVFALFGLYDYFLETKSKKALELFNAGIDSLEKNIELFDCGFWSKYDLFNDFFPNIASPFYHRLQIEQLKALYAITGKQFFKEYFEKWENYSKNSVNCSIAFFLKAIHKILLY